MSRSLTQIGPKGHQDSKMKLISRVLIVLVLMLIVGGAVALATWDMPPPTATREKVIPNDRFR